MKKKSFLLFEIILAIGILTICLFPIIKNSYGFLAKEKTIFQEAEWNEISDLAFYEIVKNILEKKITWPSLLETKHHELMINYHEKGYPVIYTAHVINHKKDSERTYSQHQTLTIEIFFTDKSKPFAKYQLHAKGPNQD